MPNSTSLLDVTRELLRSRSRQLTFAQIAADTKLNKRVIVGIARGESNNPGVTTIQTLYEYLAKRPLLVA